MSEREFLIEILQGNLAAVKLVQDLARVSQVWDDLVDQDKPVGRGDIDRAFWLALVEVPGNHFYQAHFHELHPLLKEYIACWFDATVLEDGSDHDRTISYVLRDAFAGFVVQCAYILGGFEWMREAGPQVRRWVHDEDVQNYKEGLHG